jgi:hypothetical protein
MDPYESGASVIGPAATTWFAIAAVARLTGSSHKNIGGVGIVIQNQARRRDGCYREHLHGNVLVGKFRQTYRLPHHVPPRWSELTSSIT